MSLPITVLGEPLPYLDGAESSLLEILKSAKSTAAGSDELAHQISDWPSRYHLDPRRTNLLWPLNVGAGMRVLDVGAGTGVNTRWLAEQGADVVSIEGSYERAEVAAERCRELTNVTINVGNVTELPETEQFDLIVCVGVLEYANAEIGGGDGARTFLNALSSRLAPGASLALAIENQLGLKYWMGYPEDHLNLPFVGLAGYPDDGIRTYSRAGLKQLLDATGLQEQHWLYPYPDYKMPVAILSDAAFASADSVDFVDQMIGAHADAANPDLAPLVEPRAVSRVVTEAKLGPEFANSFWVVAGREAADVTAVVDPGVAAWRFNRSRGRQWMVVGAVTDEGDQRIIERQRQFGHADDLSSGWLTQHVEAKEPYVSGTNLEQQIVAALRKTNPGEMTLILRRWLQQLDAAKQKWNTALSSHPYLPADSSWLPGEFLDAGLANFVEDPDGELHQIDKEWQAQDGVGYDLAVFRALWGLAQLLVDSSAKIPQHLGKTVDQIAVGLMHELNLEADSDFVKQWRSAEAALTALVTGRTRSVMVDALRVTGRRTKTTASAGSALGVEANQRHRYITAVSTVVGKVPGGAAAKRLVRRVLDRLR